MSFGTNLKKIRQDDNLTQEELAKKIDTSRSNIANYENDKNMPSVEILKKLSKIFNCSIDYLMGITPYKNPKEDLEKELYKLNLTEDEFDKLISSILDKNDIKLDFLLSDENKISEASKKCLDFIGSYKIMDNGIVDFDSLSKLINTIQSLDKSKIIHNYSEVSADNWINTTRYKEEKHQDGSVSYSNRYYMTPVYNQSSLEKPNWVEECIAGRIPVDPDLMGITGAEEHFFLRISDESMNKIVKNGAFALIHKQNTVENGEIALVLVNNKAVIGKVTRQGDFIILEPQSNDESFEMQIYDKTTSIQILGKYVGKVEINK